PSSPSDQSAWLVPRIVAAGVPFNVGAPFFPFLPSRHLSHLGGAQGCAPPHSEAYVFMLGGGGGCEQLYACLTNTIDMRARRSCPSWPESRPLDSSRASQSRRCTKSHE